MSLDELFDLAVDKREYPALIPLFIAEKKGELPVNKCRQLEHLTMFVIPN